MEERQKGQPQATAELVGERVKHKFIDPTVHSCTPKEIQSYMRTEVGVNISYRKAWRAKECAIQSLYGTDDESYASLAKYKYMLEQKNPGSLIDLKTDRHKYFMYFFVSLAPFREGWKYCRPVVIVDATFLTNYHKGSMFTASAMDANEQIFPLAYGIGESETSKSWFYFFNKLKEALGERDNMVIVSDRNTGIINAAKKVFPRAEHGFCAYHVKNNVKAKFKKLGKEFNWKFYGAAKAYTIFEYQKFMRMLDKEDSLIRPYLVNEVGNEKWARCFFKTSRYTIITSNNAESLNALTVKARSFPIVKCLDWLRERMQVWFYQRREKASSTQSVLSMEYHTEMLKKLAVSANMQVIVCF